MTQVQFTSYRDLCSMAQTLANRLDESDNKKDGKIKGSVFNDYLAKHLQGEDLKKCKTNKKNIKVEDAITILATRIVSKYQFREDVKQGSNIEGQTVLDKDGVLANASEGITSSGINYLDGVNHYTVKIFNAASEGKRRQMINLNLDACQGGYFDSNHCGVYYKWNEESQQFEKQEGIDYVTYSGAYTKVELREPSNEDLDNQELKGLSKDEQIKKLGIKMSDCDDWYETDLYVPESGEHAGEIRRDYYYWDNDNKIFILYPEVDCTTLAGKIGPMKKVKDFE